MKNTLSRKAKLFILSVLMPLSMMSIGFSSWSITSVHNVNGSFTTETVLDKGTYITSCEVEYFEYMSTGFFTYPTNTENCTPQIGDVGYLTTTLTINLEKCRSVFSADEYELQIELFNSKTILDSSNNALSIFPYFTDATYSTLGTNIEFYRSTNHVLTKFQFTPDASAQSATFTITFKIVTTETVNGKEQSVFETKVYDILQAMKANGVSIVAQAAITEVTE